MEGLIDGEIGNYYVFVSKGYLKRTWTPIVTVHLELCPMAAGYPYISPCVTGKMLKLIEIRCSGDMLG